MGETTFGKGLVQAQFPLTEGAALLLTIAHYYTPSGRLIQRDYTNKLVLRLLLLAQARYCAEYQTDVKQYRYRAARCIGGGGITPDVKYTPEKSTLFERRLANSSAIFRFASTYFGTSKPSLPKGWEPDTDVLARFNDYLHTKSFPFTDADFQRDKKFVSEQLRDEFYFRAFDRKASERAQILDDPEVSQAIQVLPKAQSLVAEAEKLEARRQQ